MTCDDVRPLLRDPARADSVKAHVESCAACARLAVSEQALDDAFGRLPQYSAPLALKRRLRASVPAGRPVRRRGLAIVGAAALAAAAVALFLVLRPPGARAVADEALQDHLRIVASAHPLDVESGGVHQVKPWFTGRIDFAPRVGDSGDDFPLLGGALALFEGRKAAAFVYKRRLHTISLFVLPVSGLDWPSGPRRVSGFNQLFWRDGELGYALVSDVDGAELDELLRRLRKL